jgi:hypothetical protein
VEQFEEGLSMRSRVLFAVLALTLSTPAFAVEPKDELLAAVNKLAESPNYSWITKVEGGYFGGVGEGRTEKNGATRIAVNLGDDTYDVIVRGGKAAAKGIGGWASAAELARDAEDEGMNFSTERFLVATIANFKTPAAQAKELCEGLQSVGKSGDAFSADVSPDVITRLLSLLRRRSIGDSPKVEVKDQVGSLKCWVRDGLLAKMELHLQGTVKFNNNERKIDRTATTEIKNVGQTKVEVPEDAKGKL